MNVDQRLHHAARELREVEIDVPPLGATPRRAPERSRGRLLPALAAPLLFVAGGLFAIGALRTIEQPGHSDIGGVPTVEAPGTPAQPQPATVSAPSIHAELELISRLTDHHLDDRLGPTAPDAPLDVNDGINTI